MYRVLAKIKHPQAKNKVLLEGVFLPKEKTAEAKVIKEQCEGFIRAKVKCDEQDRSQLQIHITFKKINHDFFIVEDEGKVVIP